MKDKPVSFNGGKSDIMCCRLHPREAAPRVLTRSHLSCLVSMHYLSDTPLSGEQIWPKSPAELLIKASSECMHALWCNFVYMRSCISLHCARGCRRNIMHAFVSSPSPCLRAQTVWARGGGDFCQTATECIAPHGSASSALCGDACCVHS